MALNSVDGLPDYTAARAVAQQRDSLAQAQAQELQLQEQEQEQVQGQVQIPAEPIRTATAPSGMSGGAIAAGSLLGAAGAGAIGAYGFPVLKYKDLDGLAKSGELAKTLDALPKETPEKAKALVTSYADITAKKAYFLKMASGFITGDSISVDEYKKNIGYSALDGFFKAEAGIDDFLKINNGKNMSKGVFLDDLINFKFGETLKTNPAELNALKEMLGDLIGGVDDKVLTIDETFVKELAAKRESGMPLLKEYKAQCDRLLKGASDGKITKTAIVEHAMDNALAENVKKLDDGVKKDAFEALKKYAPKNRVRPGLIGAAVGALAAGAAIYAYSQTAKS